MMYELTYLASFAGLYYLSLYLCGKMHVLDNRGEVWKAIIVMIPCLAAALIAVSRIMDARHHPFDVISGSLLGVFIAWASYRQYFPPITEPWKKGRAHPIRSWGTEPLAPPNQAFVDDHDEGTIPLRNRPRDEERMDRDDVPVTVEGAAASPPLNPKPHGYRRHDRDDAWSCSSDEVLSDGLEMQSHSGERPNVAPI
jgi:diacylglycerol diphosphate phosphatase/phosphatidate phosphatase